MERGALVALRNPGFLRRNVLKMITTFRHSPERSSSFLGPSGGQVQSIRFEVQQIVYCNLPPMTSRRRGMPTSQKAGDSTLLRGKLFDLTVNELPAPHLKSQHAPQYFRVVTFPAQMFIH